MNAKEIVFEVIMADLVMSKIKFSKLKSTTYIDDLKQAIQNEVENITIQQLHNVWSA